MGGEKKRWHYHVHQEDWWCHGKEKIYVNKEKTESETKGCESISTASHLNYTTQTSTNQPSKCLKDKQPDDTGLGQVSAPRPKQSTGFDPSKYYTADEATNLTDEDILHCLPKSTGNKHDAKRTIKCKYDPKCKAIGTNDCQGYCNRHFCDLVRQGFLLIAKDQFHPILFKKNEPELTRENPRLVKTGKRATQKSTTGDRTLKELCPFSENTNTVCAMGTPNKGYQNHNDDTTKAISSSDERYPKHGQDISSHPSKSYRYQSETTHRSRQTKAKRSSKSDDVIESGEEENELPLRKSRSRSKQAKTHCVGPSCYNDAEPGKLCKDCDAFLTRARVQNSNPPMPSKPKHNSAVVSRPMEIHDKMYHGPKCEYHHRKHYDCEREDTRACASQPPHYRCTQPVTRPMHTTHHDYPGTGKNRRKSHDFYHYNNWVHQPRYHSESPDLDNHLHAMQAPFQTPCAHVLRQHHAAASGVEQWRAHHAHQLGEPPSFLSETTSLSVDDSNEEESFVESVNEHNPGLKRCPKPNCNNWGNQSCRGYCNECYRKQFCKRH